jgi:class 3 adenylate cyclase
VTDRDSHASIDDLLDRAVHAVNDGDRETAEALAEQVLAVDGDNTEAEQLLAPTSDGEIRRLTILFADLVDSTALSTRVDIEVYRTVVGHYRDEVIRAIERYEGHLGSTKGDGLLAVFGHPTAHENDAHRAVQAGLDIAREITALSKRVRRQFGFDVSVRVGVHRGLVYLDKAQDDVYGLGANLAARMCSIADQGRVAVSETIERVVRDMFELEPMPPTTVKGIDGEINAFHAVGERDVLTARPGPLIGRERELEYLIIAWEQAQSGSLINPGVAFAGEGGIGKTRLAYSAVDIATRSGAEVLGLFGSPFHADSGLRPVRRLLERRCTITRDLDPAERLRRLVDELERAGLDDTTLPLLAAVLGIAPDGLYEPAHASGPKLLELITNAVRAYLLACMGDGPALLLADDVHWFDEDTLEVIQGLLADTSGRLLVVLTGRALPELPESTKVFQLSALTTAESDALVQALHPDLTHESRATVAKRCDGIPLFIEEVVAKLKELPSADSSLSQVPDTLYETLFARLRSTPNALPVVGAAALMGARFDRTLLASVTELDQADVDSVLAELTRARVFHVVDADNWRFHHELLREVAEEVSPPTVRRNLHSRIADALVAAAADNDPEWPHVARHYEAAERHDDAATALQHAAVHARQRGALIEARTHLERALNSIGRTTPGQIRDRHETAVRLERGFLLSAAQGHASEQAAAEFERCLYIIGERPGPELHATLTALLSYYATRGDMRRSTEVAASMRSNLLSLPDATASSSDATDGVLAGFRGDFDDARRFLERGAAAIGDAELPEMSVWYAPNDPLAMMFSFLGVVRWVQGDLAGAEQALALTARRCDALGFPHGAFSRCYGLSMTAWVYNQAGLYDRAMAAVEEQMALAVQSGFDEWVMLGWSMQSTTAALQIIASGETDQAALEPHIQTMTSVVDTWRTYDLVSWLANYDGVLAGLLIAAGDLEAARARLDLSLQMGRDSLYQNCDAELMRLRAHTRTDPDERHDALRAAVDFARAQGAHASELASAADDVELVGSAAKPALIEALGRFPADQTWPALERARALAG